MPKNSKSKFRATIGLGLVDAVTKVEQWPMPFVKAELTEPICSSLFVSLAFYSGYRQCLLDPSSYDACGIIAPQKTFVLACILHGLKDLSAYVQSIIPLLFDSKKQALKAWINDFTIHTQSKSQLTDLFEHFYKACAQHTLRLSDGKSVSYTKIVESSGRVIDGEGDQMDPRSIREIQKNTRTKNRK